jgi:hypothetical protein
MKVQTTKTQKNRHDLIDKRILAEIRFFFKQQNDKALFQLGIRKTYNDFGIPALNESVEYFPLFITLDDRTKYIAENIVLSKIGINNIICNTIISHFYGARGIHQVATREPDPKKALIDFERILIDTAYKNWINNNLEEARKVGISIYGRTELRTSLFDAANTYVAKKEGKKRNQNPVNIIQWVASFIEKGITEAISNTTSLKALYNHITKEPGVGQYYGYHCAISNSINPNIAVSHDEPFCVPGPGAIKVLNLLFPNVSPREFSYSDRVVWLRDHQQELFGAFELPKSKHNFIVDGKKIFKDEQTDIKVYNLEVGLCQFGVYQRLRENSKLISNRKVARLDESVFKKFISVR